MKISKVFIISVLTIAMPISQARAVIPDVNSVISDVIESSGNDFHISGADSQHVNLIQGVQGVTLPQAQDLLKPNGVTPSVVIDQTPGVEELETQEQKDNEDLVGGLALPGHHFWTTKKLVITTTLLLTTGLLVGLLLLLASGGGSSGSGSSSDGGTSGGGSSPSNSLPPSGTDAGVLASDGTGLGGGSTPGGGTAGGGSGSDSNLPPGNDDGSGNGDLLEEGGSGAGGGSLPIILGGGGTDSNVGNGALGGPLGGTIPHHPEPSTFLLMGLGLLVPFLRKRSL